MHETERFFRVRKLAGNFKLVKSEGAYAAIYKRKGLDGAECAKDARVMYMLPISGIILYVSYPIQIILKDPCHDRKRGTGQSNLAKENTNKCDRGGHPHHGILPPPHTQSIAHASVYMHASRSLSTRSLCQK